MPDEDGFECERCGRSFDSQRGLSIHKTQAHSDEEQETKEPVEETGTTGGNPTDPVPKTVSVSVKQAMIVVFALGLTLGFSGGMVASSLGGQQLTGNLNPDDNTNTGQGSGETTMEAIKQIAESTGADGDRVEQCVNSAGTEEINQDRTEITQAVGNIGTPTFFIGNSQIGYTEVTGAQPYSRMKPMIDRKLQEAESGGASIGEDEYRLENISFEGEPALGNKSAPINIIEYSDYGCPWCAEWHGTDAIPQRPIDQEDSFNKVKSNYVETGDAQFVLKDYPVPRLHPKAMTAHKAANCVLENSPDSFWEFSQKLYEERDRWKS